MIKKMYFLLSAGIFLLSSCSQSADFMEPATIIPSNTNATPPPAPDDSTQINLFRMVPADFLGAGYYDLGLIMEDANLKTAFESVLFSPFQDSQLLNSSTNGMISISRLPDDSTEGMMSIVYVLYGDFADISLLALVQESEFEEAAFQEYQGFELMVEEQGESLNYAMTIMDMSIIVFGEESGVRAVIDTALGVKPSPLTDMGAALPQVLMASIFNNCPQYEDLGCTVVVVPGLALATGSEISILHIYAFENPDQAASALESIKIDLESGNITQTGSIKISGETVTQEGRYIIVEDLIPIGEIGILFE